MQIRTEFVRKYAIIQIKMVIRRDILLQKLINRKHNGMVKVVVKEDILLRRNEAGIVTMGLMDFLLDPNSLDA